MTTRDELADLIYRILNPEIQQDAGWIPTVDGTGNVVSHITADAILARWRLVPVEEDGCQPCTDLRTERIKLHYEGFSDRQIAERQGMSTRTIAAWRRKSGLKYNDGKQHRAADELTHHDQAAGIYGNVCQCGQGAEHDPRTHHRPPTATPPDHGDYHII